MKTRTETDFLGEKQIPAGALWGIHTARAVENFPISGRMIHPEIIKAFGEVKLACVQTNILLGFWKENPEKQSAIEKACFEMSQGLLDEHIYG
jgi:aspartate ammonia-lyase